jgi:endonuclease/exonuclease/phosphatase family metal-dependent hydrolase
MFPIRISLLTYNLWTSQRWPEREPALREFFECYRPDIICLQELCEQTRSTVDAALPDHHRVDDPFPGWTCESNIYWNARLFQEVAFGVENVAITSNPHRGLFWVRLQVIATGQPIFVSTAHFTYQEHPDEIRTGQSPRLAQVEETIKVLKKFVSPGEPAFFMGDLNDPVLPTYKLAEAGYQSCFVRMNLVPPPTWPSFPTANIVDWQRLTTQTMDWIVSNRFARPISASAPQFYSGDLSPSDHWPVLALYQLEE